MVITNGTKAVFCIIIRFLKRFVLVSELIRRALVLIGEHRSPQNAPEITAPPEIRIGMPILLAIVIHITPIVADVPKAVPVRNETKAHSKKQISTIACGLQKEVA